MYAIRSYYGSASYWGMIHGALSELAGTRISALDGLSEAEAERCLGKSSIIACGAGDRVSYNFV